MDTEQEEVVDLVKGSVVDLVDLVKKKGGNLREVAVTLSWSENTTDGPDHDPDVFAFLLGENNKVPSSKWIVKGWPDEDPHVSPDGAVVHSGDDLTGGTGETITLDTTKLDARIARVLFSVTIYHAAARDQNMGSLGDCHIRLDDVETGKTLAESNLSFKNSVFRAVNFCEVIRQNGGWWFRVIGEGYNHGLAGLYNDHGVRVGENEYDDGVD